ncbi:MAG TPA: DUF2520 domain-containing protein [Vulgatibacter sp.]
MRGSVFVLGTGRLGSALARSLSEAGWAVEAWSRSGRRVRIPGARQRRELPPAIRADLLVLTVPDRAISEVARMLADTGRAGAGNVVAHCSGALGLEVLEPLRILGAEVGSLHPLAAVSRSDSDLRGSAAALDGTPAAVRLLRRVARDSGLRPIAVAAEGRAAYHAAASLAANGLVALADLAVDAFALAGVPRDEALQALVPLLDSAVRGLAARGLPGSLTGPVSRADSAVVEAHLRALAGTPAASAYRVLAVRAIELARAQGADEEGLERIESLLARPPRRRGRKI